MAKISVVVNTFNEEVNLPFVLSSVKNIADEIVVVDMKSEDATKTVAKKFGAKIFEYERVGYVEPARNFAISKATGDWILILDADERIPSVLAAKLKEIVKDPKADYYRIARKNINFGKWIKNSRWWPDYNIRFFKKGHVIWNEVIHSVPMTEGVGIDLPAEEKMAIIHRNYPSIEVYIERMNRYTSVQAEALMASGYKFSWPDLVRRPLAEFISRFFAGEGYKDGLHGFSLSLLQAFSEMTVYLKLWQKGKFAGEQVDLKELGQEIKKSDKEIKWWILDAKIKSKNPIFSIFIRFYRKVFFANG